MKKTLSIISIAIIASSFTFADTTPTPSQNTVVYKGAPCPVERGLQSGFYLGGQLGYDFWRVRQNVNLGPGLLLSNPTTTPTGFIAGIFTGWGHYFYERWYLGLEALANYSNASTTWNANDSTGSYLSRYSTYNSFGLGVLPGYKINVNTLLYVRLGFNWIRLKTNETSSIQTVINRGWTRGFVYGLGMESVFSGNWSIRTEYNHTDATAFNTSMGTRYTPEDNQVMFGVIYHFT